MFSRTLFIGVFLYSFLRSVSGIASISLGLSESVSAFGLEKAPRRLALSLDIVLLFSLHFLFRYVDVELLQEWKLLASPNLGLFLSVRLLLRFSVSSFLFVLFALHLRLRYLDAELPREWEPLSPSMLCFLFSVRVFFCISASFFLFVVFALHLLVQYVDVELLQEWELLALASPNLGLFLSVRLLMRFSVSVFLVVLCALHLRLRYLDAELLHEWELLSGSRICFFIAILLVFRFSTSFALFALHRRLPSRFLHVCLEILCSCDFWFVPWSCIFCSHGLSFAFAVTLKRLYLSVPCLGLARVPLQVT